MVEVRIGTRGDSLLLATDAPDLPISVTLESARLRAGTKPRDCFDLRGLPAYMADVAVGGHEKMPSDGHVVARWRS